MGAKNNRNSESTGLQEHFLVLRCQVGDERAFKRLYKLYNGRTLRFLKSLVKGDQADDLNQEVWITVYRRIAQVTNPERFKTWLFQISRNKALDYFRQAKRISEFHEALKSDAEQLDGSEEATADFDKELLLKESLDQLSQRHREVLVLNYLEGMDYEEVALITGCSLGTVKSRIHNAKLKLKYLIT